MSKESGISQVAESLKKTVVDVAVDQYGERAIRWLEIHGGNRAIDLALAGEVKSLNNRHVAHIITMLDTVKPSLSGEELALAESAHAKLTEHQPNAPKAHSPQVGSYLPEVAHSQTTVGPH